MDKATFEEYLHYPHSVKDSDKTRALTERYPYCQTVHLLHALSLKNSNDTEFEEQLPHSSIHVSDRKVLFEHLHNNFEPEEASAIQEEQEEESNETTSPQEKESNQTPNPTEAPSSTPEQDSSSVKEETNQQKEEEEIYDTTLERQYLSEAVSTQIFLDPENALEVPEEPQEKRTGDTPEATEPTSDLKERSETNEGTPRKRPFTAWLSKDEEQEEKENKKESKTLASKREKVEFFSSAELAKESLKEDEAGMVSETLANVHAKQGNFKKAIHAFEQLRLKYPEKSSYFADRIADVKQKMKQ